MFALHYFLEGTEQYYSDVAGEQMEVKPPHPDSPEWIPVGEVGEYGWLYICPGGGWGIGARGDARPIHIYDSWRELAKDWPYASSEARIGVDVV
jgi:hypothetical protein